MSNVELIVAALGAGAAAGLTDTASTAVKDGYTTLKQLVRPWVRGAARQDLEADVIDGEILKPELVDSGADSDEQVVDTARKLLWLTDPEAAVRFRVQVSDSKGVQIGDYNTQTNHF